MVESIIAIWIVGWILRGWYLVREYDNMHTQIKSYWSERAGCYFSGFMWPITMPMQIVFQR